MNVDAPTAELIRNVLIFLGVVLTVSGGVFATVWSRRGRRDRAPVDERDDMRAQFEAMAIANKTVVDTMKATNEANDRIVRTLTEDKARMDLLITDLNARLTQREADINRLYEQREKHVEEIEQLQREAIDLRSDLAIAENRRRFLEEELREAQNRLNQLKPASLQDEIAKQRQAHHDNTGEIPTQGAGT